MGVCSSRSNVSGGERAYRQQAFPLKREFWSFVFDRFWKFERETWIDTPPPFVLPMFPLIPIKYAIIGTTLVIVRIYVPWKFISSVAFHSYQFPISSLSCPCIFNSRHGGGGGGSIFRIILGRDTWKLHGDWNFFFSRPFGAGKNDFASLKRR